MGLQRFCGSERQMAVCTYHLVVRGDIDAVVCATALELGPPIHTNYYVIELEVVFIWISVGAETICPVAEV